MICPVCGGDTAVVDCARADHIVIRRRRCLRCGETYYTAEHKVDTNKGRKALRGIKERRYNPERKPPKESGEDK